MTDPVELNPTLYVHPALIDAMLDLMAGFGLGMRATEEAVTAEVADIRTFMFSSFNLRASAEYAVAGRLHSALTDATLEERYIRSFALWSENLFGRRESQVLSSYRAEIELRGMSVDRSKLSAYSEDVQIQMMREVARNPSLLRIIVDELKSSCLDDLQMSGGLPQGADGQVCQS